MISRPKKWHLVVKIVASAGIGLSGALAAVAATSVATSASALGAATGNIHTIYAGVNHRGELDCNGVSPVQRPLRTFACTDIRGLAGVSNQNMWNNRFYDNGRYIGHDEPDATFLSTRPGSGNNVTWNLTLGKDPTAAPTGTNPGKDVSHYFELTPAPWLSMAICDPNSYPQTSCTPQSDANAPSGRYIGGGSAFMEMQFYPPGNAPWVDSESCDNTHWCAALTIDSLSCTEGFAQCNTNCEEPVNFAFISTNGVPAGPPSPQKSDLQSSMPGPATLLMNPGDRVTTHMWDAPVPGESGQRALKIVINDLTTGKTGFMQASAKNGFQDTSIVNCAGTPFNFQPEYSTASVGNYIPWAALQTNISTEFETGHYEPCTTLSNAFSANPIDPYDTGGTYNGCSGPYETAGATEGPEAGDALCYAAGDTHTGYTGIPGSKAPPNQMTGCQANWYQNGDLNFDGTPYWSEWPTSATLTSTSKYPSSFVESLPTTTGSGYSRLFFQTDVALSESTCTATNTAGCTVPPQGPGNFYPYWSEANAKGTCALEFGNVSTGVNDFSKDAQYGTVQYATLGYPEFESKILDNTCPAKSSQGYLLSGKGGQVASGGDAPALPNAHGASGPIVGIASTPNGAGYYATTATGSVYTGGNAMFQGDLTTQSVRVSDIVAIVATADGGGYWLIGADGGVFRFGDAKYLGSLPGRKIHVHDVVAMAASPSRTGYYLVGADGGVFTFGTAKYHGSLPGERVHVSDIRAIILAAGGTGYDLFGSDGSTHVFGSGAPSYGSLAGKGVSDIVGVAPTTDGRGYWMAGANGAVYPFGDARSLPSNRTPSDLPITGITTATVNAPY